MARPKKTANAAYRAFEACMGDVIYGTDFRKHLDKKVETFEQMAAKIFDDIKLPDTAPSDYVAPEKDPA